MRRYVHAYVRVYRVTYAGQLVNVCDLIKEANCLGGSRSKRHEHFQNRSPWHIFSRVWEGGNRESFTLSVKTSNTSIILVCLVTTHYASIVLSLLIQFFRSLLKAITKYWRLSLVLLKILEKYIYYIIHYHHRII